MILYWYALEDKSLDTVILHVGVNGLLNSNTQSNVDNQKNINKLESEIFFCPVWCKYIHTKSS